MEAISAGASTLAFVVLGLKSVKLIYDTLSEIKDAPQTVRDLLQDVRFLQVVLERFQQLPPSTARHASATTIAQLREMFPTFVTELNDIAATVGRLIPVAHETCPQRFRKKLTVVIKDKRLAEARNKIRDRALQASTYLGLLQLEAASEASIEMRGHASETTVKLDQVLGEVKSIKSIQERLQARATSVSTGTNTDQSGADADETLLEELQMLKLCNEVEESIAQISKLVKVDALEMDDECAEEFIGDLKRLIRLAKDELNTKRTSSCNAKNPYARRRAAEDDIVLASKDLNFIKSLLICAPELIVNQTTKRVPSYQQLLAGQPRGTIIKQKRLREEINIEYGCITVTTNKRQCLRRGISNSTDGNEANHRDVVASITFRPSDENWMLNISAFQSQIFGGSVQSIPRISVSPIVPNDSLVFRLVREGQLEEFLMLLAEGKASIRDHDEQGMSLLHYAAGGNTSMCNFLIEHGADVDEMATQCGTALSYIMGLGLYDRMRVLVNNGADPTLSYPGWDNPLTTACSSDMPSLELFLHDGNHFALDGLERPDMNGRTRLHQVCMASTNLASKRKAVEMLITNGAKINARITQSWSADDHQTLGFTCLHGLVYTALRPHSRDDLETLILLLQKGADPHVSDHHGYTVSMRAHLANEDDNPNCSRGSYRGDLWDAALAISGHSLEGFRASYPRVSRYNRRYTRSHFEALWTGYEHLCPYWDDTRYPAVGGDDTYSKLPPQRCAHTSCFECEDYQATTNDQGPSTRDAGDTGDAYLMYQLRHPRSPSIEAFGMREDSADVSVDLSYGSYDGDILSEACEKEAKHLVITQRNACGEEACFDDESQDHPSPSCSEDSENINRRLVEGEDWYYSPKPHDSAYYDVYEEEQERAQAAYYDDIYYDPDEEAQDRAMAAYEEFCDREIESENWNADVRECEAISNTRVHENGEPPSPPCSEDGEDAFLRLMGDGLERDRSRTS